jgi:hypothetical protein
MDAIETLVYTLVALIVGFLLVGVISGWHYDKTYNQVKEIFFGKSVDSYEHISLDDFPRAVLLAAEKCAIRENNISKVVYIESAGALDKTLFFNYIKNASLCNTIESAEEACGSGETIANFSSISLPAVVKISCQKENIVFEAK